MGRSGGEKVEPEYIQDRAEKAHQRVLEEVGGRLDEIGPSALKLTQYSDLRRSSSEMLYRP